MKNIIFFDIDGTLLDHSINMHSPSLKTIEAMKKLTENGNYCVVATARTMLSKELEELPFAGKVLCNGGYVEFENKEIHNSFFTTEEINTVVNTVNEFNAAYIMGGLDEIVVNKLNDPLIKVHEEIYGKGDSVTGPPEDKKINGITLLFNTLEDMYDSLDVLPKEWNYHIYETPNIHFDIYPSGFSKGKAVEHLYKYLDIPYEKTYAFGDGQNDKEMMELVKYSTAMGNAVSEIKEAAYMITENVNDDGIYKALKKYKLI